MATALQAYEVLVQTHLTASEVAAGQMFGKACLKVGGKAFVAQHKETVVFKLAGAPHVQALAQPGAVLWDPSGKGRPMKEWVALPISAAKLFPALAQAAKDYVGAQAGAA